MVKRPEKRECTFRKDLIHLTFELAKHLALNQVQKIAIFMDPPLKNVIFIDLLHIAFFESAATIVQYAMRTRDTTAVWGQVMLREQRTLYCCHGFHLSLQNCAGMGIKL